MDTFSETGALPIASTTDFDWSLVYKELLPKVFHYFAYRVGDVQSAEDLTAATFERAWRHRTRYRSDLGKFEAWVFGIARKVAAEHYRKGRQTLPLESASGVPSGDDALEDRVQKKGEFVRLARLTARLPDRERELLALKYGARLTNRAIARLTHLNESNVGTILYRVVQKLRDEWEQEP